MAKRRFQVKLEPFDPEVEALEIQVGDEVYSFVADFRLLSWMEAMKDTPLFAGIDPENPTPESVNNTIDGILELLWRGLKRRHPDITIDQIESWTDDPVSAVSLVSTVYEYINTLMSEKVEDVQGEALKTIGSTSGAMESTTSASPPKKSGTSSRKRSKR